VEKSLEEILAIRKYVGIVEVNLICIKKNLKMANKKAEKYSNFHRVLILKLLYDKKPEGYSASELSKKFGISRIAVYHHLEHLEGYGLVKQTTPEKSVGNPIKWVVTPKASPIPKKVLKWANKMFKFDKKLKLTVKNLNQ
jgi:DNA-binding transcriptional ArsR family regulator